MSSRRTHPHRRELGLLAGSHGVDDFYQGAIPSLVALLVTSRSYGYTAATGITLAATLLSSVVQPVFGVLTDRRELRAMVPLGMATAGLGIGLCGIVDSYAWTWGCVALSGLGVAAYHPQAARAAGRASSGTAAGMSWFSLGGNIGYALGPAVTTAVLVTTGIGGTPLLALPAVAYAALLARRLGRPEPSTMPASNPAAGREAIDAWRPFVWLTAVISVRSVFFFGVSTFLALFVLRHLHGGTDAGAAAVTVLFVAGLAGTMIGGRLADAVGRVRAMQLGYLLSVPGLACILLAPDLPVAFVGIALLGLAIYLPVSVQVTLGQEYLPNRTGTASGVTLGLAVSVGGLSAPLFGLLADAQGLTAALALLLVLPVVALLLTRRLPETARAADVSGPVALRT